MTRENYGKTLDNLTAMLKRKPMTARAIAAAQRCSRPVAYQRLEALRERGETVYALPVREASRGPLSVAYGIR